MSDFTKAMWATAKALDKFSYEELGTIGASLANMNKEAYDIFFELLSKNMKQEMELIRIAASAMILAELKTRPEWANSMAGHNEGSAS